MLRNKKKEDQDNGGMTRFLRRSEEGGSQFLNKDENSMSELKEFLKGAFKKN